MNLIGEIIEKEIEAPAEFKASDVTSGFPAADLLKKKRALKFKAAQKANITKTPNHQNDAKSTSKSEKPTLEAQKIHQENLEKIASMTDTEIMQEQQELLSGLDPKLVKTLLKRSTARSKDHHDGHQHAEGYDGWIGGARGGSKVDLGHLDEDDVNRALGLSDGTKKSVSFAPTIDYQELDDDEKQNLGTWEDVDDVKQLAVNTNAVQADDQVAPEEYQLLSEEAENAEEAEAEEGVHFPKPVSDKDEDLDLDDPNFFDKLHDKYYPDLPKETSKLSWMTTPVPQNVHTTYESVSDIRFDFQGNIVELPDTEESINKIPTYLGLHHHSDNPNLAGYTLPELAHLSRSVVPGQRCISIKTLGRILHKLGLHKYNVAEDVSAEINEQFEDMLWSIVEELRIIDTLTEAADENRTKNLSVRNYALEALWLWRQGGGRKGGKEKHSENLDDYIS